MPSDFALKAMNTAHRMILKASLGKVDSDPTFDSAKVDRIAGAIRDGKFKINAEAIADKLIVNAEELLGKKFN